MTFNDRISNIQLGTLKNYKRKKRIDHQIFQPMKRGTDLLTVSDTL